MLVDHIIKTLDELKVKHPDMGVTILGDFNRTNIDPLCRAHCLKQVVNKPTFKVVSFFILSEDI